MFVISNERKFGTDKEGKSYDYIAVRGIVVKRNASGKPYLDIDKGCVYPDSTGKYDPARIPSVGSFVVPVKGYGFMDSPPSFEDRSALDVFCSTVLSSLSPEDALAFSERVQSFVAGLFP